MFGIRKWWMNRCSEAKKHHLRKAYEALDSGDLATTFRHLAKAFGSCEMMMRVDYCLLAEKKGITEKELLRKIIEPML